MENNIPTFVVGWLCGLAFMFVVMSYVIKKERHQTDQDLIKAGLAEWTIDPQTGERRFIWIKATK